MDGVGVLLETRSCLVRILNLGDGMGLRGSRGESAASWDPWRYGCWHLDVAASGRGIPSGLGRRESGFSQNEKDGERAIRLGHDRDGPDLSVSARDLVLRKDSFSICYRLFVSLQILRGEVLTPATSEIAVEQLLDDFDFDFVYCRRKEDLAGTKKWS